MSESKYVRKTYTCELLTPMIMSGADQSKAELRATSIKGMLRWWWRALNPTNDYGALRKREYAIFGGVLGDDNLQLKSQVSIDVRWLNKPKQIGPKLFATANNTPLNFLAYGTEEVDSIQDPSRNRPERKAFDQHSEIAASMFRLSVKYPNELASDLSPAIAIMLNYSGFGMKARNGYGQVNCLEVSPDWDKLPIPKGLTDAPGFGDWTRIELPASFRTARAAHEEIAKVYRDAKNPLKGNESKQSISGSGNKNLFAAHSPNQFEHRKYNVDPNATRKRVLPRKAKPVQLYIRKASPTEFFAGILALPYKLNVTNITTTVRSPGGQVQLSDPSLSHEAVIQYFMDSVRVNNSIK